MLKTVLAEHAREEEIFAQSGLNWTAVRAAVLTGKEEKGGVIATNSGKLTTIPRADLADFLVVQIGDDTYARQAICVTGK